MLGLMQDWPLLCHRIIDHAAIQHGERPVVTRSVEGPIHTTNYAEIRRRALKLAQRLDRDGIKLGDRVATLAWNTWRHLEGWYGILGIGAIYHTVNPRLFPEQIGWIVNHAEDRMMFVDLTFVPLLEKLADGLKTIERYRRAHRRRAHAEDDAEERGRLRGMDRRGGRRLRLEELRRKHRGRHVLHLRHHRQSQGRALFAPLQRAARLHGVAAGRQGHRRARRGAAGRAAVPRQLLVARVLHAADRRLAGHAGTEARRAVDLRTARHLQGDVHRRRADRVAGAARPHGEEQSQAAAPEAHRDRRLGLAARHDAEVRGELWRRGHPRLGHDRDEPARLALHPQAGIRAPHRRRQARRADEAGPSAVRRRDEDHRRHAASSCPGTARPSAG